jgi:acyl-CoA hydrolase/ribosomal protein S18 acetylase RimI-like enzyme
VHDAPPLPPPDWRRLLKPGQRILLGSGAACPLQLVESMLAHVHHVGDLELVHGLTLGPAPWTDPRHQPHLKVNAFYLDPRISDLVNAGTDDYTPVHYSEVPGLFRDGVLRIDVVLVMVSPPDAYGYCSLGPSVDWMPAAIAAAHTVVAQINPRMPRTGGLSYLHTSAFASALEAEAPLPEWDLPPVDEVAQRIGAYVAQLINDGDTLQFDAGPIGQGVAHALKNHRRLGIHSELVSDGMMRLFASGVVDNSAKTLLPGKIVATKALGSQGLYGFLDHNPHFDFRPTDFVCNPLTIARNERMVAVNSALMVDLTGQVVVDSVQGRFRSGVGSTTDFVRGAAMSRDGRPIIALPSTGADADGRVFSRIAAELPPGAGVGCNRADVHYIVTEHGIATLRGRTIQERVTELIQVAHPDFREALLAAARAQHLVAAYFQLAPPVDDERHGIPTRRVRLRDNRDYILRPLNPADDRRLQEFFYSHTEETVIRRYGFTVTRMSRERAFELVGVDQTRDLALAIMELQGPRQVIHAVGRYYLDADGKAAEMAFVVGESKRRVGMARTLLGQMLETAAKRGLAMLWAQVDRDNIPMLRLFRSLDARELPGEDSKSVRIEIPLAGAKVSPKATGTLRSLLFAKRDRSDQSDRTD